MAIVEHGVDYESLLGGDDTTRRFFRIISTVHAKVKELEAAESSKSQTDDVGREDLTPQAMLPQAPVPQSMVPQSMVPQAMLPQAMVLQANIPTTNYVPMQNPAYMPSSQQAYYPPQQLLPRQNGNNVNQGYMLPAPSSANYYPYANQGWASIEAAQKEAVQKLAFQNQGQSQNLPLFWEKMVDASGYIYYIDHSTGKTQWHPPNVPQVPSEAYR